VLFFYRRCPSRGGAVAFMKSSKDIIGARANSLSQYCEIFGGDDLDALPR
jgi:hypothetical protein